MSIEFEDLKKYFSENPRGTTMFRACIMNKKTGEGHAGEYFVHRLLREKHAKNGEEFEDGYLVDCEYSRYVSASELLELERLFPRRLERIF